MGIAPNLAKRSAKRAPRHPGQALALLFDDAGIEAASAARQIGVSRQTLNEVLSRRRPLTPEIALRLQCFIGISAEALIRMQAEHDLHAAEIRLASKLNAIPRCPARSRNSIGA